LLKFGLFQHPLLIQNYTSHEGSGDLFGMKIAFYLYGMWSLLWPKKTENT